MTKIVTIIIFVSLSSIMFGEAAFIRIMAEGTPQTLVVYGTSVESMAPNGTKWVEKIGEIRHIVYIRSNYQMK